MWVDMFTVHMRVLSLFLDPWDAAQWAVIGGTVNRGATECGVGRVPEVFGLMQILRGLLHQSTAASEIFRTVLFLREVAFRRARHVRYYEDLMLFLDGLVCVFEDDNRRAAVATLESRPLRRIWWMLQEHIRFQYTDNDLQSEAPGLIQVWFLDDYSKWECLMDSMRVQKLFLLMTWHPYLRGIHEDIINNFQEGLWDI